VFLGRSWGNARIFVGVLHGHDEQRRRRDIGHDAVGRRQSARRELGYLACGLPLFPARAPDRRIRREDPSGECRTELVGANSSLLSFWISPAPLVLAVHARKPFEVHDSALARSARVSESPSPGGANNPTIRGPSGGTDLDFCRRACFTPYHRDCGEGVPHSSRVIAKRWWSSHRPAICRYRAHSPSLRKPSLARTRRLAALWGMTAA
jgi:hypothetical protein